MIVFKKKKKMYRSKCDASVIFLKFFCSMHFMCTFQLEAEFKRYKSK